MRLRDLATRHLGLKILALVMAVILWFLAVGRETGEIGLKVPLEMVNFPKDMLIANEIPDGISIRIRGSVALTRQVAERKLRFRLDLAGAKKGSNNFTIVPDALGLPRGLEVTHLSPSSITVELERLVTKKVGLLPVIQGEPEAGYVIDEIVLEPNEVEVRGPESQLLGLDRLWTEPIDVTKLTEPTTVVAKPVLPSVAVNLVRPTEIKTNLKISPKLTVRAFKNVKVEAVNSAYQFELEPETVDLLIRGPVNAMTELVTGKGLRVVLDLAGFEPGRFKRKVVVRVPEMMEVLEIKPDQIWVKITKELSETENVRELP